MATIQEIVQAFLEWFESSDHAKSEDFYEDEITQERMQNLSREGFIDFFQSFAHEGGMIQSGGHRTAGRFGNEVEKNYDNFRHRALEPFHKDFNLEAWLTWAETIPYFSPGHCTIFLNRVDKHRYVIVNQKSIDGYELLSGQKAPGKLADKYRAIEAFEKKLLEDFPALRNFFRADALMHYLLGTEEGKRWTGVSEEAYMDYFDLEGMRAYAGKVSQDYDPNDAAAAWYKKTQEQLKYLVGLLEQRIGRDLKVNYTERPKGQGGRGKFIFRDYLVVGFAPDHLFTGPKSDLFIHLIFEQLNENPVFGLAVNVNFSKKDNPFIPRRAAILEATTVSFPVDADFPDHWDVLLDKIEGPVRTLIDQFVQIAAGKEVTKNEADQNKWTMHHLNTILYGPPGTGKTFTTKNLAIQIIEDKGPEEIEKTYPTREDLNRAFLQYQKAGQIGFITFHQSFGYEDFVEGIKPKLVDGGSSDTSPDLLSKEASDAVAYTIEDGIFKEMAERADSYQSFAAVSNKLLFAGKQLGDLDKKQFFKMSLGNTAEEDDQAIYRYCIENDCIALGWGQDIDFTKVEDEKQIKELFDKNGAAESRYEIFAVKCFKLWMRVGDIVFISDGNSKVRAIGLIDGQYYYDNVSPIRFNHFRKVKWLIEDTSIPVDQIYGKKFSQQTIYAMWTHLVKLDFFRKSEPVPATAQNHVLIIDEINRGNISSIFGELITLIEPDKRKDEKEYISVTLPYSKKLFSIPPNLYLIGTMNTADRSVEALDTALRRRFSFVQMKPEPELLKPTQEGIDLQKMLKIINQRLEVLIDADHTIGHAWLWEVKDLDGLSRAFKDKILPLLQEFFYNDYEKIGLVLGEKFVTFENVKAGVFALFNGGSDLRNEYTDRVLYRITSSDTWDEAAFRSIYTSNQENA